MKRKKQERAINFMCDMVLSTPRQFNKKLVNFGQSLDFLKFWEGNRGKQ